MSAWEARPTVYKGVPMRSRLEARFAAELDANGGGWSYEPRAYAGDAGQYLPDFEVLGRGEPIFFEVKPTEAMAIAAAQRMEVIWESEPDAQLYVAFPIEDGSFFAYRGTPDGWAFE